VEDRDGNYLPGNMWLRRHGGQFRTCRVSKASDPTNGTSYTIRTQAVFQPFTLLVLKVLFSLPTPNPSMDAPPGHGRNLKADEDEKATSNSLVE
jgi:hypothetical protein